MFKNFNSLVQLIAEKTNCLSHVVEKTLKSKITKKSNPDIDALTFDINENSEENGFYGVIPEKLFLIKVYRGKKRIKSFWLCSYNISKNNTTTRHLKTATTFQRMKPANSDVFLNRHAR